MISEFRGEYRFLSNFFPVKVEYEGVIYPTVEHAYQAAKTTRVDIRQWIYESGGPGEAKRRGRRINIREDWDNIKLDIMRNLILQKFTNCTRLKNMLLSTGDEELVEGNTWNDRYWGKVDGDGNNWLGKILMETREKLGE